MEAAESGQVAAKLEGLVAAVKEGGTRKREQILDVLRVLPTLSGVMGRRSEVLDRGRLRKLEGEAKARAVTVAR